MPTGTSTSIELMPPDLCKVYLIANPQGSCEVEVVTTVEEPVSEEASTPEAGGSGAASGAFPPAPKCKSWVQKRRPADGSGLWQFGHNGKFCYDETAAWFNTYRGKAGYHNCGYTEGIGFSVTIISCRESGDRSSKVRFDVTGQVCFLYKGSPLCTSYMPRVTGSKTGTLSYFSG